MPENRSTKLNAMTENRMFARVIFTWYRTIIELMNILFAKA